MENRKINAFFCLLAITSLTNHAKVVGVDVQGEAGASTTGTHVAPAAPAARQEATSASSSSTASTTTDMIFLKDLLPSILLGFDEYVAEHARKECLLGLLDKIIAGDTYADGLLKLSGDYNANPVDFALFLSMFDFKINVKFIDNNCTDDNGDSYQTSCIHINNGDIQFTDYSKTTYSSSFLAERVYTLNIDGLGKLNEELSAKLSTDIDFSMICKLVIDEKINLTEDIKSETTNTLIDKMKNLCTEFISIVAGTQDEKDLAGNTLNLLDEIERKNVLKVAAAASSSSIPVRARAAAASSCAESSARIRPHSSDRPVIALDARNAEELAQKYIQRNESFYFGEHSRSHTIRKNSIASENISQRMRNRLPFYYSASNPVIPETPDDERFTVKLKFAF